MRRSLPFHFLIINSLKVLRLLNKKAKLSLYLITGYFFIGIHQLFEYLSIYTGNQIVYKIGLVFSITSMIFNFKATEILLEKSINMKYIYISLFIILVHLITREMTFNNSHFYVSGQSHFYWGLLWMAYFLYWNFIHLQGFLALNAPIKYKSLVMPFAALNVSFSLAALYSFTFGIIRNHPNFTNLRGLCGGLLTNFEIVFDAPSIWCCFTIIQGFFLYQFIKHLKQVDLEVTIEPKVISLSKAVLFSIILIIIIFLALPFFSALSYKMILK